ncbi:MAG: histidinol-phosphate transaminase [Phycisphaerae bacterium]|nr:histidinol-phosphate transaminase [Phycisphaerae bacterium]
MGYFRENIEKLAGYVPGFQPESKDIIKLNTNENSYPPSPAVLDVIRNFGAESLRRYPDPLGGSFRKAAGKLCGLGAENIMCCNGGDDLLNIAIRSFCDEGRPLAYPVPTYSLYPVLAGLQNCEVIEVGFDGEYNLPSKLAGTAAGLTIVCNPNAPTGSVVSIDELAGLADEIKGVLLVDEAYVDFAEENCVELVKRFDNVIILRSMSKGYSLAGLRFGYAVACEELIAGLMKVKDSYNVDAVSIAAATAAIEDQDYHKEVVGKVKKSRNSIIGELRNMGFEVGESFANFVLAGCKGCKAGEIYAKLVERDIFVRYFALPGLEDKLRISVGTEEQNGKLLNALRQIVSE